MSIDNTRRRFEAAVRNDGGPSAAAYRLGCSTTQVLYIINGTRNPGMRLARAIQAVYSIEMQDWVESPKMRSVKGVA